MSDESKQGELYTKSKDMMERLTSILRSEYDMYESEFQMEDLLDKAKAEIPTRADAEKVLEARLGHKLKCDGFEVGMTACIHAELFGKWADKWFGEKL